MTRERAESIVRDLVASGEVAKGQATKAADWLVERSRTGTEELAELVRREIRQQVAALGLATKDDLARLEAQIDELRAAAQPPAAAAPRKTGRPRRPPASAGRLGAGKRTGKAGASRRDRRREARRRPASRRSRSLEGLSRLRRRLDAELVRRGLVPSRDRAQAEIAAGRVHGARRAGHQGGPPGRRRRPRRPAGPAAPLRQPGRREARRRPRPVRGSTSPAGRALDAGASTGGFTDCLLQRGAAHVVAVDVGRGQLDQRLRADPRVTVRERTNVRHLTPADLDGRRPFDLVVADLSFISLRTVAPRPASAWPRPAPTWSSWSSPSSRPAGPRPAGSGA